MAVGWLVLEDGTRYEGRRFGAIGRADGDVVVNLAASGHRETLTDPVFCGQIVVLSHPVVGNLGGYPEDLDSSRAHLRGLVVRQLAEQRSGSPESLACFLEGHGVVGLEEVDTRALARHLRARGSLRGVLSSSPEDRPGRPQSRDWVGEVTTHGPYRVFGDGPRLVVIDCGLRPAMLRDLTDRWDADLVIVPATTDSRTILDLRPAGVIVSSGPGDIGGLGYIARTVGELLGRVPMFGLGLGHHLLAAVLGAEAFPLPFGHRGSNHPVQEVASGRVLITAQNHGHALKECTLAGTGLDVTHRSCQDATVEGTRHRRLPVMGVDFHAEARPGPADGAGAFGAFWNSIGGEG
ncbi:MAG TPA: carbamoyl phosphate synthase small subunit [Clostridiales bacterium]|nr:carbamoyl phosphate synthase small subunit [Clostridiales bacterium]